MWTAVRFGKYEGKTLPQIVLTDPDWFFWACDSGAFKNRGALADEAKVVSLRARTIRVQGTVDVRIDRRDRLASVDVRPGNRYSLIDMSLARGFAGGMDKTGARMLVDAVRDYVFGGQRSTRRRRSSSTTSIISRFLRCAVDEPPWRVKLRKATKVRTTSR
jgi:hypothetical protein